VVRANQMLLPVILLQICCMHGPCWDVIVHCENDVYECIVKDLLKQQFSCRGFTCKKNVIQKDRPATTFNTKWWNKRTRNHTVLLIICCLLAGNQYRSVDFLRLQEIFTEQVASMASFFVLNTVPPPFPPCLTDKPRPDLLTALRRTLHAVAYRGGWFGGSNPPPPRNSEDNGGVLDRMSKKNRRLDFLL